MAGTADSYYYVFFYYTGTFDGQGHTLSFNWNAGKDDKIAPFKYVKDATIKNLRTQGKITSKGDGLSGMVYAAFGTTTISGCISDVDITGGGRWLVCIPSRGHGSSCNQRCLGSNHRLPRQRQHHRQCG